MSMMKQLTRYLMATTLALLLASPASGQKTSPSQPKPEIPKTNNFVIVSGGKDAKKYKDTSELLYQEIAKFWFSHPLPHLHRPVKLTIGLNPRLTFGGGATRFMIAKGHVFNWRMRVIARNHDEMIQDVLPHEIGHVVLHAALRKPIPTFFSEGASVMMESEVSRRRQIGIYLAARRSKKVPPLSSAVDKTSLPKDMSRVHLFYGHGFAVTHFLVTTYGPDLFIAFLTDPRKPSEKIKQFYKMSLDELEAAAGAAAEKTEGLYGNPSQKAGKARVVYAFSAKWCEPCKPFKSDLAAGKLNKYRFVVVEPENEVLWNEVTTRMVAETKHKGNVPMPSWWIPGSRELIVMSSGYSSGGLLGLIDGIARFLASIPAFILTGDPAGGGESPAVAGPTFQYTTADINISIGEDWRGVTLIVLAPVQDVGEIQGRARAALLGLSVGRIERRFFDLTKNHAKLAIVAERTQPKRYAAALAAARLEPGWHVLVCIPRKNVGLIKGMVVRMIERIGEKKLQGIPPELILERTHPRDYAALLTSLQTVDDATPVISKAAVGAKVTEVVKALSAGTEDKIVKAVADSIEKLLPAQFKGLLRPLIEAELKKRIEALIPLLTEKVTGTVRSELATDREGKPEVLDNDDPRHASNRLLFVVIALAAAGLVYVWWSRKNSGQAKTEFQKILEEQKKEWDQQLQSALSSTSSQQPASVLQPVVLQAMQPMAVAPSVSPAPSSPPAAASTIAPAGQPQSA